MITKSVLLSAIIAYAEARFGREQIPIDAISQVQGGDPGAAATIAGAAISDLLGGADPCAKLLRADEIIAELGDGDDALAAAIGLVAAEKNTNPFANGNAQVVCDDPTLPVTEALRGITPLIDPDVDVDGLVNDFSAQTVANPVDATGLSVLDILLDAGFGDLVSAPGGAGAGAGADEDVQDDDEAQQADDEAADQDAADQDDCEEVADEDAAEDDQAAEDENAAEDDQAADDENAAEDDQAAEDDEAADDGDAAAGDADFGLCTPTIIFEGGQNGRPADEFTFQIADELARGGQQEALNPNIITNALCNQLTNVCEANEAAIALCLEGKAEVEALGTRDKATADAFNEIVGFAGAVTNPSGGPENPPAAEARRRRMRRGLRMRI